MRKIRRHLINDLVAFGRRSGDAWRATKSCRRSPVCRRFPADRRPEARFRFLDRSPISGRFESGGRVRPTFLGQASVSGTTSTGMKGDALATSRPCAASCAPFAPESPPQASSCRCPFPFRSCRGSRPSPARVEFQPYAVPGIVRVFAAVRVHREPERLARTRQTPAGAPPAPSPGPTRPAVNTSTEQVRTKLKDQASRQPETSAYAASTAAFLRPGKSTEA